jgi:hypothetical protein
VSILGAVIFLSMAKATTPARAPAHEALYRQCLLQAADTRNPWALAHGITGLGKGFAAADGRLASEVMVTDFLQQGADPQANPYGFVRYAADKTPVEPHSNLLTKTLVLAGVPRTTAFQTAWGKVTLEQLIQGVQRGFRHVPASEEYWRDAAWTLDLLAATHKPGAVFTNGSGEKVSVDAVMDDALAYLEKAQAELGAGLDAGQPQVDKRKQGIYAHTCGGLHLFQAVGSWARHPAVRKRWGARYTRQIEILFYRLGSESRQYQAALQAAPQFKLEVLTQMVKFYGHFLETTGRLKRDSGFRPSAPQKQELERAKALLDNAVRELQAAKAFDSMEQLKVSKPQLYLDLIGDSCHAANGYELWR